MSDLKSISPLLDGMIVEKELSGHNGQTDYAVREESGSGQFILKVLSLPSSENQVRALLISGAYADEAAVHTYYAGVVEDIRRELDAGKRLSESGRFCGAVSYQVEEQSSGIGFDIYILYPRYVPLSRFLYESAITHLRAVNLGIDLCEALSACREAGFLFENVRPENIFLTPSGHFLLGNLGLASLEDLQYASIPEEYLGPYSAPELSDISASPNKTMDLYAVGMLLFRIYNGNHGPFEDESTGEAMAEKLRLTGKPLPTPMFADYELASIIMKACSTKLSERYQTPEEFKQALVLYMQRNEVSDTLIAPPIVIPDEPLLSGAEGEDEEETDAPMRMTDAENLDEDFRKSFAPDLTGGGSEKDVDRELLEEQEAPASDVPGEEASDKDPDQLELDAFLASIAEVVGEAPKEESHVSILPQEPEASPEENPSHDYVDAEPRTRVQKKKKKKRKGGLAGILILIALIAAIVAVGVFLVAWYFVEADGLEMVSRTTEQITVRMDTGDKPDRFSVTCTDQYGNAFPASSYGNEYTFTGLTENTGYTITVRAAARHRLTSSSVTSLSVTTPESTQILEFTADYGQADGEVLLAFDYEGTAPEEWHLHYVCADGSDENTVTLAENSTLLSGLQLGQVYTFTLENTSEVFLSGAVQTSFEVLPLVHADKFNVSQITGKTVTLTWLAGDNVPEAWEVTCSTEGQEDQVQTVTDTTCSFTLPNLNQNYTFTLNARGMTAPIELELTANPIVVDSMDASIAADGTVTVTWATEAGSPAGGWYVSYGIPTSQHDPILVEAEGNSIELKGLIPNASYTVALQPADGSSVFGLCETQVDTPEAQAFKAYGVKASSTFYSLWPEPSNSNWDYTDLKNPGTYFSKDTPLVVCLEVGSYNSSDDIVNLLYVIRDSDGNPVTDASASMAWNDMWHSRRHASSFPNPGEEGSYTLEIYVNGALLTSADFYVA